MTGKNVEEHIELLGQMAGSSLANVLRDAVARVKTAMPAAASAANGDDGATGKRAYDYDATPGSVRQSPGAWLKATRTALIDATQRARRNPGDAHARFNLLMSTALYAAAGDAFVDIVVDASAIGDGDPLNRPGFKENSRSAQRKLRPEHLAPVLQDAVLDVTSGDKARVNAAVAMLDARLLTADAAEAQIVAALLGQIGDPMNRGKINRLAAAIEKMRWEAKHGAADVAATQPADASDGSGKAEQGYAGGTVSPSPPAPPAPIAEVVSSGGETARRVTAADSSSAPLRPTRNFYGEEEL